jgi:hypothetical protein
MAHSPRSFPATLGSFEMTARMTGGPNAAKPSKSSTDRARETRLAAELRQNLRRRKSQKSARNGNESAAPATRENDEEPDPAQQPVSAKG